MNQIHFNVQSGKLSQLERLKIRFQCEIPILLAFSGLLGEFLKQKDYS